MYTYNPNISARANQNKAKRVRTLQLQKQMIAIVSIIVISLLILLGSSISAFANAASREPLQKYYKSIQVEAGDTLWTLADNYVVDGYLTKKEFIQEVCRLNHLSNGQIQRGEYIVIVYYATAPMQ